MSNRSVRAIARELSFESRDGIAFGACGGIFASIVNEAFTGEMTFTVNELKQDQLRQLAQFLDQNRKTFLLKGAPHYAKPYLRIRMDSRYAALTTPKIVNTFRQVCGFLQSLQLASACASCGNPAATPAVSGQGVSLLCDACFVREAQNAAQVLAGRKVRGSYLIGLLGVFCGGFLSLAAWALFGLIGILHAISAFITAWLCAAGYGAFKGKTGKAMVWIIGLGIFAFTMAGVVVSWMVVYLTNGYTDLSEMMGGIFSDMTLSGIPADWIIAALFAAISSFAMLRGIRRKAAGRDVRIERIKG